MATPTCQRGASPCAIRPGMTMVDTIGSIEKTSLTESLADTATK
jgi:hypothetical protein